MVGVNEICFFYFFSGGWCGKSIDSQDKVEMSPFNYIESIMKKRVDMFNPEKKHILGGGFKYFYFHPNLGKIPVLTNIFQMG